MQRHTHTPLRYWQRRKRRRNRLTSDAREQTERLLAAGGEDLTKLRSTAEEQAQEARVKARADAREIVSEAHLAAREVLREGTDLSRNLRELSVSLHNNAERLIRDVRLAHGGLTARLDQAGPGVPRREDDLRLLGRRGREDDPGDDLDVPEFIPPG